MAISFEKVIGALAIFSIALLGGYYFIQSLNTESATNEDIDDLSVFSQASELESQSSDVFDTIQQNNFQGTPFEIPLIVAQGAATIVKALVSFIVAPFTTLVDLGEQYLFLPTWLAALLKSYGIWMMLLAATAAFLRWNI